MKKTNLFKTLRQPILMIALILLASYWSQGQVYRGSIEADTESIRLLLTQEGFQNVMAFYDYNQLIVSYENRRYRLESEAIKQIVRLLDGEVSSEINQLVIVTRKLNIPILYTTIPLTTNTKSQPNSLTLPTTGKVNLKEVESYDFSQRPASNTGNYRIELELKPELRLALGGFPDPVVHQFNILPALHFYLWKGARLSWQTTLPIWNEFDIPDQRSWRPRIIQLEQRFRLPAQTFVGLSMGYFTKNRYGSVVELGKYFWNGNLLLSGKVGYTGYANYEKEPAKVWKIGVLDYVDYKIEANYYFKKWNVISRVEYAKTLFDQYMLRGSVSKYFKEIEIGFFVYQTQKGNNYGFHCAIPLMPKKYFKPSFLSIRPASSFDYIYHGTQNYVTQYETIRDLGSFMRQLEPFFIQRQLFPSL